MHFFAAILCTKGLPNRAKLGGFGKKRSGGPCNCCRSQANPAMPAPRSRSRKAWTEPSCFSGRDISAASVVRDWALAEQALQMATTQRVSLQITPTPGYQDKAAAIEGQLHSKWLAGTPYRVPVNRDYPCGRLRGPSASVKIRYVSMCMPATHRP